MDQCAVSQTRTEKLTVTGQAYSLINPQTRLNIQRAVRILKGASQNVDLQAFG